MKTLLIRWLISTIALIIVSYILPGFHIASLSTALIGAIILGLLNALVKPILLILTLPITILTLGLFTFILNALILLLASHITPGFVIEGFGSALLGSILLSIVSMLLQKLVI